MSEWVNHGKDSQWKIWTKMLAMAYCYSNLEEWHMCHSDKNTLYLILLSWLQESSFDTKVKNIVSSAHFLWDYAFQQIYFKTQMSHTVPKASDIFSREPGAFSFGIRMRTPRFMANQEGCRVHPKQTSLSGNIINYIIPIQLLYVYKKGLTKRQNDKPENILESKHKILWYDRRPSHKSIHGLIAFFQKAIHRTDITFIFQDTGMQRCLKCEAIFTHQFIK